MQEETLKQLNTMLKQQEISVWSGCIYASVFLLIAYGCYRLKRARIRKIKPRHTLKYIQKNKIIIAIQIKDFVVKYQQRPGHGFLPLTIQISYSFLQNMRRKLFGLGHYYKPIFPVQKIKQFMHGLYGIEKVQLMLYTSLEPQIVETILSKLGIDRCFPTNMRKYCDLENSDDQKHAIEVDQESRRVVIVTPTYDDHRDEDQKYFLVLRPKGEQQFLKTCLKLLKNFVEKNQNINNLHDQLGDLKINYDSEISESEY